MREFEGYVYLAGIRLEFAGKQFEEGRFTGAVGADDAVAVAGRKFEVDILEKDALPEGKAKIAYRYQ